jgi:hypothetical protein
MVAEGEPGTPVIFWLAALAGVESCDFFSEVQATAPVRRNAVQIEGQESRCIVLMDLGSE